METRTLSETFHVVDEVISEKSINIFNKFDQNMLNKRFEKLNQMLLYLSEHYAELKAVAYLDWIELYKNVLLNSPAM